MRIPERLQKRPVGRDGKIIPWYAGDDPDSFDMGKTFPGRIQESIDHRSCFMCGDELGEYQSFMLTPEMTISRFSFDAPAHPNCVELIVHQRWDFDGICAIWTSKNPIAVCNPIGPIVAPGFYIGDPTAVTWYNRLGKASRQEIIDELDRVRLDFDKHAEFVALEGDCKETIIEDRFEELLRLLPPQEEGE